MDLLSWVLYIGAFGSIALAVAAAVLVSRLPRLDRPGFALALTGLALLTVLVAIRWAQSTHPPLFGSFENTLAAAWSLLAFSALVRRGETTRSIWRYAAPWVLLLLVWGARYSKQPVPLTISERSLWVDVHVAFAWAAFVPLLVAATISLVTLVRTPREQPSADQQVLVQRLLMWGFFGFSGMLVTGAWYLNVLFGTLWQWGVVETLSLIAWVVYGVILHRVLWRRWRGTGLQWGLALTIPILLLVFFVWSVFPGTFHFFDIPLVKPY